MFDQDFPSHSKGGLLSQPQPQKKQAEDIILVKQGSLRQLLRNFFVFRRFGVDNDRIILIYYTIKSLFLGLEFLNFLPKRKPSIPASLRTENGIRTSESVIKQQGHSGLSCSHKGRDIVHSEKELDKGA